MLRKHSLTQSRDAGVKTAKKQPNDALQSHKKLQKDSEQAPATRDSKYVYGDADVISARITQLFCQQAPKITWRQVVSA